MAAPAGPVDRTGMLALTRQTMKWDGGKAGAPTEL